MSVASAKTIEEMAEKLLNCDVCGDNFSLDNTPRILPCHHSFCFKCLDRLSKAKNFMCPLCRRPISVHGPTREAFPMDTTRLALLDLTKSIGKGDDIKCEGCNSGRQATSRCQDCMDYLCGECCQAHSRVRTARNHVIVSLSELVQTPALLVATKESCDKHLDRKLELFCLTCSKAICAACAFVLHKERDGHNIVELADVLGSKQSELVSLCEELDDICRVIQDKVKASNAILDAAESSLKDTLLAIDAIFDRIIKAAVNRQIKVKEALITRVKADQLDLQEQLLNFTSLLSTAQATADYGRRIVALGMPTQILWKADELERELQNVKQRSARTLRRAVSYKVDTAELPVLIQCLESFGPVKREADDDGEDTDVDDDVFDDISEQLQLESASDTDVPILVPGLTIQCPVFKLDTCRSGRCCILDPNGFLSNAKDREGSSSKDADQGSKRYRFPGARGTMAVPKDGCHYWQVRFTARGNPEIKDLSEMCEMGVASHVALRACAGQRQISLSLHCAFTVWVYRVGGQIRADTWYRGRLLTGADLCTYRKDTPVDHTVGFLVDSHHHRLHVINVNKSLTLWSWVLDLSKPLFPAVRVWSSESTGADVGVEFQTGKKIKFTPTIISLLDHLIKPRKGAAVR